MDQVWVGGEGRHRVHWPDSPSESHFQPPRAPTCLQKAASSRNLNSASPQAWGQGRSCPPGTCQLHQLIGWSPHPTTATKFSGQG